MKNSVLISYPFLRVQSILYVFIIAWTIMIRKFPDIFVIWKYVELVNQILFFIYLIIGLGSVLVLIGQILNVYLYSESSIKKGVWTTANIVLYWGVLIADLCLLTECRI
jgi:hypothetical protein